MQKNQKLKQGNSKLTLSSLKLINMESAPMRKEMLNPFTTTNKSRSKPGTTPNNNVARSFSERMAGMSVLNVNNEMIYLDPMSVFELKQIDINELNREKEENLKELHKVIEEIETLNFHFDRKYFTEKALFREAELRNHIKNLGERIHTRDPSKVKDSMQILHEEITKNVKVIHEKMKAEIVEKRKDIENRINLRLMDAEFRHKRALEEKVAEQETMLRSLNNITTEMIRIKDNYEQIKKRIDHLFFANTEKQKKINEENNRHNNIKLQIKGVKIKLKNLVNRININNEGKEKIKNVNLTENAEKSEKVRLNTENSTITRNFRTISYNNISTSQSKTSNYIFKNTDKNCQSLMNSLNLLKSKLDKIKSENESLHSTNGEINQRVYEIIKNSKLSSEPDDHANILTTAGSANPYSTFSNFNSDCFRTSEDRKKLIDLITKDKDILGIIRDEKFPTINISHRTVNNH